MSVIDAVRAARASNASAYHLLLHALAAGDAAALDGVSDCAGLLAEAYPRELDAMVAAALSGPRNPGPSSPRAPARGPALARFIAHVTSVNAQLVERVLRALAERVVDPGDDDGGEVAAVAEGVLDVYPAAVAMFGAALVRAFPHHRNGADVLAHAVAAVLRIAAVTHFAELRGAMVALVWDRMTSVDVEIPQLQPATDVFAMDEDAADPDHALDPLVPKLDGMLREFLLFLDRHVDRANVRHAVLLGFEREVLRVQGCRFVPYALLFACATSRRLCDDVIVHLWSNFADTTRPRTMRRDSIVYLASLLARVPCDRVRGFVDRVVAWLVAVEHPCDSYYWAFGALAHVLTVHTANLDPDYLRALRLSKMILSPLQPLATLPPSTADRFCDALVARQIVDTTVVVRRRGTDHTDLRFHFEDDLGLRQSSSAMTEALNRERVSLSKNAFAPGSLEMVDDLQVLY